MPPTHRKLRRKELKQPDEFRTFFDQSVEFLRTNLTQMLVSAAVVAAIGIVAVSVYYYERSRDAATASQFYTAFNALTAKQYKTAQDGFLKLATDEPGRELGRLARFYLADCYLAQNDLPRARDSFAAYLSESHDPMFETIALTDLAGVYERMGDFKKAESAYRQAASAGGPGQTEAELGVARALDRQGDKQGAIAEYRRFLDSHPFGAERGDVIEALADLGAPAEAAPPPVPVAAKPIVPAPAPAPAH
jgi:tetratricopeptide (TPR) repeat protein